MHLTVDAVPTRPEIKRNFSRKNLALPEAGKTVKWRRLSAPDLESPRSPRTTSQRIVEREERDLVNHEQVLRKKLTREESILRKDFEQLLLVPKNSKRRKSLKRKIDIRTSLVDAMRNTIEVQENVILNSGYIKFKKASSKDFQRFWCVICFPKINVFPSERDCFPNQFLRIDKTTQIIVQDFGFILHLEKEKIYFMTDSLEECNQWTKALSLVTGITVVNATDVQKKQKRYSIASITSSDVHETLLPVYQKPECDNFEVIKGCFSENVDVEYIKGKYYLKSGTLEDIVKWCIIHCATSRNLSAGAIFLCKHWICTTEKFNSIITNIWTNWEEKGFPFSIPRNIISERLANFSNQYIESPIVGIQTWNLRECSNLRKMEIDTRREYQKAMVSLHSYFSKTIKDAKVKPKTIFLARSTDGVTITFSDTSKVIENPIKNTVKDIASQITLKQAKLFENIPLDELMDKNWENPEKSPNLAKFTSHSNQINSWVIDCILSAKDNKKQMSRYIKFMKIALQLHSLKNFNSCVSVLGGLESAPISRLKNLKNIPDNMSSKLEKLKEQYSPLNGYRNYRGFGKVQHCIPLLGVYLRDLTLISDGNAKYLDENKTIINFDRMKLIADRVLEFNEIDASTYLQDIEFLPDLSSKLDQLPIFTSEELYQKSLKLQPIVGTKSPEQQLEELQSEFDKYKSDTQKQIEVLHSQLQHVETVFDLYKTSKEPKASSKTKKDLNNIRVQLLNAMLLCDDLLDEPTD